MECLVEFPDGRVQYMSAKEANALRTKEDLRLKKSQTRKRNHEKITNVTSNANNTNSVQEGAKSQYELQSGNVLRITGQFLHNLLQRL
jgi:hypothetical protein